MMGFFTAVLGALPCSGMKRVLLTVHKFFPDHRAGTEVLTLKVAQELQARGYEVLVVTANPPDLDARHARGAESSQFEYDGIRVHVVEEALRLKGFAFAHEFDHPEIRNHFSAILRDFSPDIVHSFHCQNLSAAIIDAAVEKDIPVVLSTTDFWFVCPIVQLKRPDGAVCQGPEAFAGNCLTCYTPRLFPPVAEFKEAVEKKHAAVSSVVNKAPPAVSDVLWSGMYSAYAASKVPEAIEATVKRPAYLRNQANKARAIMVPTRLMRDIFIKNGIREDLIHLVPFGIETAPLEPYQKKLASNDLRIGFIGTLFEHKGVDLLIQAFQALPDKSGAVLKIYGDLEQFPDYGMALRKQASLSDSHRINFMGTFPNAEFGKVLSELDVLVVPSRWYENTPLVIQSAFATKTPVIATDLGGMSEIIQHEFNGLLFKLNDVESLSAQLRRLIDDRRFLNQLIDNIPPERNTQQMVDDIEEIYGRLEESPVRGTRNRAGLPGKNQVAI